MPIAVEGGLTIADLFVIIVMLCIIVMLWTLINVRGPAGHVPFIGTAVVSLIDGLRGNIVALAHSLEGFLSAQQAATQSLWDGFVKQVMSPLLAAYGGMLTYEAGVLRQLINQGLAALRLVQADTSAIITGQLLPAVHQLELTVATDEHYVQSVVVADLHVAQLAIAAAESEINTLRGGLANTTAQLIAAEQTLARLYEYFPLIQALSGVEAQLEGGIGALTGELGQLGGRVVGAEQNIGKVLPLAAIAALGAVAIANLIRIAKNPCEVCQGINLNDYESRFAALEFFGES